MRNFAIGSMVVLFAALAGTAVAEDRYSVPKSAGPDAMNQDPLFTKSPCSTAEGRNYAVGMSACIDESINKCTQIVNPKNPNDVKIGWVDQHQKCTP